MPQIADVPQGMLEALDRLGTLTVPQAKRLLGIGMHQAARCLAALCELGLARRIARGKYARAAQAGPPYPAAGSNR